MRQKVCVVQYKGQVNNCNIADEISLSGKHSYPDAIARCLAGHRYRVSTTLVFGLLVRGVSWTSHVWLANVSEELQPVSTLYVNRSVRLFWLVVITVGKRTEPMFVQVQLSYNVASKHKRQTFVKCDSCWNAGEQTPCSLQAQVLLGEM
jgi:hypothetical protein